MSKEKLFKIVFFVIMCVLLVNFCTVNLVCEECKKVNGSVCGPVGVYILTREFQPLDIIIPIKSIGGARGCMCPPPF